MKAEQRPRERLRRPRSPGRPVRGLARGRRGRRPLPGPLPHRRRPRGLRVTARAPQRDLRSDRAAARPGRRDRRLRRRHAGARLRQPPRRLRSLHTRLVQGYALDALDAPSDLALSLKRPAVSRCSPATRRSRSAQTGSASARTCASRPTASAGAGLNHEEELVQLTVFPDRRNLDQPERRPDGSRIRRPSRRRLG